MAASLLAVRLVNEAVLIALAAGIDELATRAVDIVEIPTREVAEAGSFSSGQSANFVGRRRTLGFASGFRFKVVVVAFAASIQELLTSSDFPIKVPTGITASTGTNG